MGDDSGAAAWSCDVNKQGAKRYEQPIIINTYAGHRSLGRITPKTAPWQTECFEKAAARSSCASPPLLPKAGNNT